VIKGYKRLAAIAAPSQSATQHQEVNTSVLERTNTEERRKSALMIYCE
jgi:hypothetical protein